MDNYVRLGDIIYGLINTNIVDPCFDLYANIIQIKTVPSNVAIGYDNTYITPMKMQIATILCGFADGYPTILSNRFFVKIKDTYFPIVGKISMNYITIGIPIELDIHLSDRVCLISSDPNSLISLEKLSKISNIPPYELTCRFNIISNKTYIE
jgi:alanine racemase